MPPKRIKVLSLILTLTGIGLLMDVLIIIQMSSTPAFYEGPASYQMTHGLSHFLLVPIVAIATAALASGVFLWKLKWWALTLAEIMCWFSLLLFTGVVIHQAVLFPRALAELEGAEKLSDWFVLYSILGSAAIGYIPMIFFLRALRSEKTKTALNLQS